jgi:hypothetical protein
MNKIQRRELVRAKRLQQAKNRELGRALDLVGTTGTQTDAEVAELCKSLSKRVLQHLSKDDIELPEGLTIGSERLRNAARNEIVERQVLRTKGHG